MGSVIGRCVQIGATPYASRGWSTNSTITARGGRTTRGWKRWELLKISLVRSSSRFTLSECGQARALLGREPRTRPHVAFHCPIQPRKRFRGAADFRRDRADRAILAAVLSLPLQHKGQFRSFTSGENFVG